MILKGTRPICKRKKIQEEINGEGGLFIYCSKDRRTPMCRLVIAIFGSVMCHNS